MAEPVTKSLAEVTQSIREQNAINTLEAQNIKAANANAAAAQRGVGDTNLILSDILKEMVESQRLTYTIINELNSIQLAFAELIRFMVDQKDQDRIAANAALTQAGKDPKDAAGEKGMDVKAEGGFAIPAATLFGAVTAYVYGLSEYIRVFTLPKTIGILGAIPKAIGTFTVGISDFFKKLGNTQALKGEFFKVFGPGSKLTLFLNDIRTFFRKLLKVLGPIGTAIKKVLGFVGSIGIAIGKGFQAVGTGISKIGDFAKMLLKPFQFILSKLGAVGRIIGSVAKFIGGPITLAIFALFDFVKGFFSAFKKTEDDTRSFGERLIDGLLGGIKQLIKGFVTLPLDLIKDGIAFILGLVGLDGLKEKLKNFSFSELFDKAFDYFFSKEGLIADIKGLFNKVIDPIKKLFTGEISLKDIYDSLPSFLTGAKNFLKFIKSKTIDPVVNYIKGLFGKDETAEAGGAEEVNTASMFDGIDLSGILDAIPSFDDIRRNIGERIVGIFESISGFILDKVGDNFVGRKLAAVFASAGKGAAAVFGVSGSGSNSIASDGGGEDQIQSIEPSTGITDSGVAVRAGSDVEKANGGSGKVEINNYNTDASDNSIKSAAVSSSGGGNGGGSSKAKYSSADMAALGVGGYP